MRIPPSHIQTYVNPPQPADSCALEHASVELPKPAYSAARTGKLSPFRFANLLQQPVRTNELRGGSDIMPRKTGTPPTRPRRPRGGDADAATRRDGV
ncbi:hypothetical protein KCP70_15055 [Salmonella enterica subsp. enterica]|nr:hypothetical protein KCP70_15055 [Salmonella enterica subsp. enterica]